jgi:hypothetical protein
MHQNWYRNSFTCKREDPHRKGKNILQSLQEHLEIPPHISLHQNPPVQLQSQISIAVWGRDVASKKDNHQESANIHEFLPTRNTENPLVSYHP